MSHMILNSADPKPPVNGAKTGRGAPLSRSRVCFNRLILARSVGTRVGWGQDPGCDILEITLGV